MSRVALKFVRTMVLAVSLAAIPGICALASATAADPHMDPRLVPGSCSACHAGHGASRSPMLPTSQKDLCLGCHETQAAAAEQSRAGLLTAGSEPTSLSSAMSMPYVHPVDDSAFSRDEPGVVTCTSCHSPHRGKPQENAATAVSGLPRRSARNPTRMEYQMCERCHGSGGATTEDLTDLSRMLYPGNRSFHPVEAVGGGDSPSLLPGLSGRQINCTDCHGNGSARAGGTVRGRADSSGGSAGPHGSPFRYLLAGQYTTTDGNDESAETYALCYTCHDREKVLDASSPFPLHRLHVVDEKASCASCHNAHGSVANRGLIRFGEETTIAAAAPSSATGELNFVSTGPGSGTCSLTCHGYDHPGTGYGGLATRDARSTAVESLLRGTDRRGRSRSSDGSTRRAPGGRVRVREDPPL